MLITTEVTISASQEKVWEFLADPSNHVKWMEGVQSREQISGRPDDPGSEALWTFLHRGHPETVREECVAVEAPGSWTGIFRYDYMDAHMKTVLRPAGEGTRLTCTLKIRFNSDSLEITAPFMKNVFQARQARDLHQLKRAIEAGR